MLLPADSSRWGETFLSGCSSPPLPGCNAPSLPPETLLIYARVNIVASEALSLVAQTEGKPLLDRRQGAISSPALPRSMKISQEIEMETGCAWLAEIAQVEFRREDLEDRLHPPRVGEGESEGLPLGGLELVRQARLSGARWWGGDSAVFRPPVGLAQGQHHADQGICQPDAPNHQRKPRVFF